MKEGLELQTNSANISPLLPPPTLPYPTPHSPLPLSQATGQEIRPRWLPNYRLVSSPEESGVCPCLIMIPRKGLVGCTLPMPTSGPLSCSVGVGSGCTKGLLDCSTFRRSQTGTRRKWIRVLGAGPMDVCNMRCLLSELPSQGCTSSCFVPARQLLLTAETTQKQHFLLSPPSLLTPRLGLACFVLFSTGGWPRRGFKKGWS